MAGQSQIRPVNVDNTELYYFFLFFQISPKLEELLLNCSGLHIGVGSNSVQGLHRDSLVELNSALILVSCFVGKGCQFLGESLYSLFLLTDQLINTIYKLAKEARRRENVTLLLNISGLVFCEYIV